MEGAAQEAMVFLQGEVERLKTEGFTEFKERGVHKICVNIAYNNYTMQVCYDYAQEAAEYFSEAQIKPLDTGNAYH